MGLSIKQIRENTVRARHLCQRARSQGFAVGAFSVDSQESLTAVAQAAQRLQAPALVAINAREARRIGFERVRNMVDSHKKEHGIEVYLSLDSCSAVNDCKRAIDAGFEFIHYDPSQLRQDVPSEEVAVKVGSLVDYASFTGAIVEGQLHHSVGSSNLHRQTPVADTNPSRTSLQGVAKFVELSRADMVSIAIGNLLGVYATPKELDLELLQEIRKETQVSLSLHGGSGTSLHTLEEAVALGVDKVSITTDIRIAFRDTLERVLRENSDEYAVAKLMGEVVDAVQKVIEKKMAALGSAGKAVR